MSDVFKRSDRLRRRARYFQVGLLAFVVACTFVGSVAGLILRSRNQKTGFENVSSRRGKHYQRWVGKWVERGGKKRLASMVFFPRGCLVGDMSCDSNPDPNFKGVYSSRGELFLDGKPADLSEARVFVCTSERKLRPIVLDANQLATLTPEDSVAGMSELPVFKEQILPVLLEEDWHLKEGTMAWKQRQRKAANAP